MNKRYCVVYLVDGIHYRFRCYAKNKRSAINECIFAMAITKGDIYDVYIED